MKKILIVVALSTTLLSASSSFARTDTLCKPLREFANSVKQGENKSIEFHTSWGRNFNDSSEPALLAKRCLSHDYAPAKAVCNYLMEYGSTEFSSRNAEHAIKCLFPKTQLDSMWSLNSIDASFLYGKRKESITINISFGEAPDVGGMVLKIRAEG